MRGQPGEATTRPRELPEVADGRNCEWPRVHALRIEVAVQLLNVDTRLLSHLKAHSGGKFFLCAVLCFLFCAVFFIYLLM